ncbi:MAG: glycosyltransferase family 2 protein [Bacteroidia bacterium]|jgi:glycosyltransferase involved in cell wall biosynthesis
MKISVVVAVMNEEDNVLPLMQQVKTALTGREYELIFVDDGSTDQTIRNIKENLDSNTHLLVFQKNYGQSQAMSAGIAHASGDVIVTLDGDLQNDPEDMLPMIEMLEAEELDVVAGNRANRKDGALLRKFPSKLANALIRNWTGVHIRDYGCTLKVFRPHIAKNLGLYGELHRFIPVLASLQGARIRQFDVNHRPRTAGTSKYGLGRTFKVMSDLLLMVFLQKYFQRPMHLFGKTGILMLFAGIGINTYLLIEKVQGHDIWGRPMLILGVICLLGGIQLITFGLMTEIAMRTYFESQNKTPYTIRSVHAGSKRS